MSGRFIDTTLGLLEGEAAQQQVLGPDQRRERYAVQPYRPGQPTYYDLPVLKEPVWIWAVPLYFWVGGASGAAMVMGGAAQPFDRNLARKCHWVGAIGGAIGTALLIYDLGRPERFLFMLRVFRPTSPMSVGSWLLATAAPFSMGAAILYEASGPLHRLGEWLGYAAGLLGMPLAGYTAVLLSTTAVPLWDQARRSLPFLFIGSGMAGAAAVCQFLPLDRRERSAILRFAIAGAAIETAAARAFRRELQLVCELTAPLETGLPAILWKVAKVLGIGGVALMLAPGNSRAICITAGTLGVLGGIALRFSVFLAGRSSSRNPQATFRHQRLGPPGEGRDVTQCDGS